MINTYENSLCYARIWWFVISMVLTLSMWLEASATQEMRVMLTLPASFVVQLYVIRLFVHGFAKHVMFLINIPCLDTWLAFPQVIGCHAILRDTVYVTMQCHNPMTTMTILMYRLSSIPGNGYTDSELRSSRNFLDECMQVHFLQMILSECNWDGQNWSKQLFLFTVCYHVSNHT